MQLLCFLWLQDIKNQRLWQQLDGFDQLATLEEQYNADYYQDLIEFCGYKKEVDWIESKIRVPKDGGRELKTLADYVMSRYHLHFGEAETVQEYLDKYSEQFFDLLDQAYSSVYGAVPFTDGMKKMLMDNFKFIIDLKHIAVILDENDKLVCMGLCFPSIAAAVQKSYGHMTPMAIARLIKAIRQPKVLDMGLVAVSPEYINKGVVSVIAAEVARMLKEDGVEYAETNLNLEDNYAIRNMWKRFDATEHKKRRAYVKRLTPAGGTENDNE